MEEGRSAFKILTDKHTGERTLVRPRCRWEHHIGMDLKEMGISRRGSVDSARDMDYWRTLVNVVLNLRINHGVN